MKFAEPLASQRLSFLLEKAASREAKMWNVYVPKPSLLDTDISPAQRDEVVRWLCGLHRRLQLYPETLVLAISILDRFLASIKARPKYLRCIAVACFFLAAKTSEEDERVPSLRELIGCSDCGCSQSEILRMEKIILDKLNWDLHTATPLHFLHIFHAMVLCCQSQFLESALGVNRSQHLALLTQRLFHCLANHKLLQVRGSMLALALITLELETCCPDWLVLTIDLLKKAQIHSSELIHCRELVARSLSTLKASLPPNTVYIYQPLHSQSPAQPQPLDLASYRYAQGTTAGSPRDPPLCATAHALPLTPAGMEGSLQPCPALLAPPKPHHHHHHHLQQVTLRCKASAKRKVEEMEVDEFFDGIKRLYNEDGTTSTSSSSTTPQEGGTTVGALVGGECGIPGLGGCSVLLSRQEGSTSPCPPLQPVSVS